MVSKRNGDICDFSLHSETNSILSSIQSAQENDISIDDPKQRQRANVFFQANSIEDDYRIGPLIGIGAYSHVKKARKFTDESLVAIKIFNKRRMKEHEFEKVIDEC